jgi:hypothetical protein
MIKPLSLIGLLSLVLFSVAGSVRADSVTASSSLDWSSATFSGPVAPAPFGGLPGAESTEIGGDYSSVTPYNVLAGCGHVTAGWTPPIACTAQIGPNDYATASANSEFTAIAAVSSPGFLSSATVERDGTIVVGTNGVLDISIPFTGTITPSDIGSCGPSCVYFADVTGLISVASQGKGSQILEAQIGEGGEFNISGGSTSVSGMLNASDTGVAPGTYLFDVQLTSQAFLVPEPGTFLMLGIGLFGLAGVSLCKRVA